MARLPGARSPMTFLHWGPAAAGWVVVEAVWAAEEVVWAAAAVGWAEIVLAGDVVLTSPEFPVLTFESDKRANNTPFHAEPAILVGLSVPDNGAGRVVTPASSFGYATA
jgi:hypothetical protein